MVSIEPRQLVKDGWLWCRPLSFASRSHSGLPILIASSRQTFLFGERRFRLDLRADNETESWKWRRLQTHRGKGMEETRYISHNTTLIGRVCVTEVLDFQQLLRMRALSPIFEMRVCKCYQQESRGVLELFGTLAEYSHAYQPDKCW